MQCIVRTYTRGYTNPTYDLRKKLQEGYTVVMCNRIGQGSDEQLEYILEKKDEEMETI